MHLSTLTKAVLCGGLLAIAAQAHAAGNASLTTSGYGESFNSMGTSGTAPPTGWSVYTGNANTTNATWTTTIPGTGANSMASMVLTSSALTASSSPTATNNNGYNAAFSSTLTSDRVLATSPTTVTGGALQLTLNNDTGVAVSDLLVSYDTRRFTSVATANELPGYWLFYSLDGTNWTNVASLNPTIASVPNTVGVTSVSEASLHLSSAVDAGSSFYLRWVDDNAQQTSPDQIIGLNNVSITAVPEPDGAALALIATGLLAAFGTFKRR